MNYRKPVPVRADRDGALRYAWLRAPPLRQIAKNQTQASFGSGRAHYLSFETLNSRPHMRVGNGSLPLPTRFACAARGRPRRQSPRVGFARAKPTLQTNHPGGAHEYILDHGITARLGGGPVADGRRAGRRAQGPGGRLHDGEPERAQAALRAGDRPQAHDRLRLDPQPDQGGDLRGAVRSRRRSGRRDEGCRRPRPLRGRADDRRRAGRLRRRLPGGRSQARRQHARRAQADAPQGAIDRHHPGQRGRRLCPAGVRTSRHRRRK